MQQARRLLAHAEALREEMATPAAAQTDGAAYLRALIPILEQRRARILAGLEAPPELSPEDVRRRGHLLAYLAALVERQRGREANG